MGNILSGVLIALIIFTCLLGLRRILRRGGGCGCGCGCSDEQQDKRS